MFTCLIVSNFSPPPSHYKKISAQTHICAEIIVYPVGECLLTQLSAGKDISRLLTGGGVDVEVLQEDLRSAGADNAVNGLVVSLDVVVLGCDGTCVTDLDGLAVGPGDTVALRL